VAVSLVVRGVVDEHPLASPGERCLRIRLSTEIERVVRRREEDVLAEPQRLLMDVGDLADELGSRLVLPDEVVERLLVSVDSGHDQFEVHAEELLEPHATHEIPASVGPHLPVAEGDAVRRLDSLHPVGLVGSERPGHRHEAPVHPPPAFWYIDRVAEPLFQQPVEAVEEVGVVEEIQENVHHNLDGATHTLCWKSSRHFQPRLARWSFASLDLPPPGS
jgi:hypothetical protein